MTPSKSAPRRAGKTARASETRDAILTAAERLFAERGVFAVSNRQVGEAAGQGNNAVVGYHFGTKADLVRAIVHRHNVHIEQLCQRMVAEVEESGQLRDWVACLVRPSIEHLVALGNPTWYARFSAQLSSDPGFRDVVSDESLGSRSVLRVMEGLNASRPELPPRIRIERNAMARLLIVHTCADRERALAEDSAATASWESTAAGLIDAITGLYLAPVTGATA
ncbi:TetR family transcriptional regulator [Nocardia callitridis]|uniref:TetR family transcriptional regulator n=1 Tax=Nocardia callitridis TaxID=648753 RepID=A0ABP9KWU0_9NOCA